MKSVREAIPGAERCIIHIRDWHLATKKDVAADKVMLDEKAIEAREDAIVRKVLKRGGTCVIVLGGAHDLADNIKRLSKDCDYVVVTPKGWPG